MSDLNVEAKRQFTTHLAANPYPGRGIVCGQEASGKAWIQVYWIMGRSPNSQNRVFVVDGTELRTEAHDPSALEDPSLIIYEAMLELPGVFLVTNGDQTRTLVDVLQAGGSFESALEMREREPDAPNYTPRISAMFDMRSGGTELALSILKANRADPELTDRTTFRPAPPPPGFGVGLTTYEGDGNPLPSYQGDPRWFPIEGEAEAIADRYWSALDEANRVSLAVKRIPRDGSATQIWLRNRHS